MRALSDIVVEIQNLVFNYYRLQACQRMDSGVFRLTAPPLRIQYRSS